MEKDDELSGSGNSYTTHFRQYDPRIGRWKSIDPKQRLFPSESPYSYSFNSPIMINDPNGDCPPCAVLLAQLVRKAVVWGGKRVAIGVVTDVAVQLAAERFFGGHSNWGDAWNALDIDEWQAIRSGGENLIKNKHAAAFASGAGDGLSYLMDAKGDATLEGFMLNGGLGVASAYLADGLGDMGKYIRKYGARNVVGGMARLLNGGGAINNNNLGGLAKKVSGITGLDLNTAKSHLRRYAFGGSWKKADLNSTLKDFLGDTYEDLGREAGSSKRIYKSGDKQVVVDEVGGYFRLQDLSIKGKDQYRLLDGSSSLNVTEGGRTRGRTKDEREAATHFIYK